MKHLTAKCPVIFLLRALLPLVRKYIEPKKPEEFRTIVPLSIGAALLHATFFLILNNTVSAQELTFNQKILEELVIFEEEIPFDALDEINTGPYELNKIDLEQLRSLQILKESQIQAFLNYRKQYGPIISLYELQVVPSLSLTSIKKLLPHIYISAASSAKGLPGFKESITQAENSYWSIQYEKKFKADGSSFVGTPERLLSRFRFKKTGVFSLALHAEKDIGELIAWNPKENKWGFDFYGGHFSLENKGFLKKIVLGDFLIQSGQGLVLGASFFPAKTSDPTGFIRKNHSLIKANSSTMEYGFLRGLTGTMQWQHFSFTPFYSFTKKDGSIQKDAISGDTFIAAINTGGYHRTTSEMDRKHTFSEQSTGIVVDFQTEKQNLQTGIAFIATTRNLPLHIHTHIHTYTHTHTHTYTHIVHNTHIHTIHTHT